MWKGGGGCGFGVPFSEGHQYSELVGSLQLLANTTGLGIAQAVGLLGR